MVDVRPFEPGDVSGVIALCIAEGWPGLADDPQRAVRVLTAPGVTTIVAIDGAHVAGFAQLQSDGEIQAHLSEIAVDKAYRRRGIALAMLKLALERAGGIRVDLVTDTAAEFYAALPHRRFEGFRIYPQMIGREPA